MRGVNDTKRKYLCSLAILVLTAVAFNMQFSEVSALPRVRTSVAPPKVQAPPSAPTGIKQYEGVLKEENTSNTFNVTIYVNFDNNTVFVDLWNDTVTVLQHEKLRVKLAMNKTLPWGPHLFFKAVSADKNTKLMVNQLKWFTLCNLVVSGVAYNGFVAEIAE